MILTDESFLQNFGGTNMNSLNTVLNTDDSGNNDTSEINIFSMSHICFYMYSPGRIRRVNIIPPKFWRDKYEFSEYSS